MSDVARHYASDRLADRILAMLAGQGVDISALTAETLFPFDQLHARQLEATRKECW